MDHDAIAALEKALGECWDLAHQFGLDPFPTHFELVPATIMYEFGAYGLPGRFAHWSFGKGYYRMKTQYDYGLSKIYEMVINANPAYAFLMESNSVLQNKLVIAHVLGHCDFFKHNAYFERTNRGMVGVTSLHADRIRKYEFLHGTHTVERFLDAALAIQEHVDPHLRFRRRDAAEAAHRHDHESLRIASSGYEDIWELGEEAGAQREQQRQDREKQALTPMRNPAEPEKDVLRFLIEQAPDLADWQRDVLDIVRLEMLYFVPQMQTKIMNEGWACARGDSLVLTEAGWIRFDELYAARGAMRAAGGGVGDLWPISDYHKEPQVPTIRVRTRRGLLIEGAQQHRVQRADGTWAALCDLRLGDAVALSSGTNVWPQTEQPLAATRAVPVAAGRTATTAGRPGEGWQPGRAVGESSTETAAYASGQRGGGDPVPAGEVPAATLNSEIAWRLGYAFGAGTPPAPDMGVAPATAGEEIPPAILRSPKPVVSAFLRGYCDAAATAGPAGITLAASRDALIGAVQIILLNYGILSTQQPQPEGRTQLAITGASALRFRDEIGFTAPAKQTALRGYVEEHGPFPAEEPVDTVIAIEPGCADVFDITVDTRHRYVANGFVNHNSYWHARIMRELDLTDDEVIQFAELNAGVVAPHRRSINPYHLGLKLFEDIERRWDNPTPEERDRLGRAQGGGRAKIFEVRELDNDLSFLRNYLTKELVDELDLYLYERHGNEWIVVEKDWERVRDGLLDEMTNFGNPTIVVEDSNYRRARELYLKHLHEGRDLDTVYAEKTLQYLYQIWGRPVHIETVLEDDHILLSYDGTKSSRTEL